MRRLAAIEYVSLDGVVQAPGHAAEDPGGGFEHGGWTAPFMAEHRRYISESFQTVDAFLLAASPTNLRRRLANNHRRERPDRACTQQPPEVRLCRPHSRTRPGTSATDPVSPPISAPGSSIELMPPHVTLVAAWAGSTLPSGPAGSSAVRPGGLILQS
jgi:hypothetical protein